ncbi:SLC13 family permease [Streptococcus moroccensis]|uniref:Di/tricarboxylate transporter n=1 Tax=Streptococcus moroccensis TaxID=1451356 RepID=A0ABT9YTI3_9STRE|nr:SLC13 family permease [Streptococcus moroccensis]MDQ0223302.1 di/tricarboxylate transporter [Streptococcus moroccensis]
MTKLKVKPFIIILLIVLGITLWNPLGLTLKQGLLLASLLTTLALWATEAVHKTVACLFLLGSFLVFGETPATNIFEFAWSDTNLLIITTTLLSVGLMHSNVIHLLIQKVISPFTNSLFLFLLFPYLLGIMLVFLIPQGFARVIIVGTLFQAMLPSDSVEQLESKPIYLFNAFIGVIMGYMFFPNGEILLNGSALAFAGQEISSQLGFTQWFTLMAVPTILFIILSIAFVYMLFKKQLRTFHKNPITLSKSETEMPENPYATWIAIVSMICLLIVWQTESYHGIPAWVGTAIVVLLFFATGILKKSDWGQLNPHFLLFLVTIFSIGKVLGQSGITGIVFEHLQKLLPDAQTPMYLAVVMGIVMLMHMAIGSAVATMSVVLPLLFPMMESGGYSGVVILLMVYILVNTHYLLPFHHATLMIGTGRQYYSEKVMLRYGLAMSFVAPLMVGCVYFPWWRFLGWLN